MKTVLAIRLDFVKSSKGSGLGLLVSLCGTSLTNVKIKKRRGLELPRVDLGALSPCETYALVALPIRLTPLLCAGNAPDCSISPPKLLL